MMLRKKMVYHKSFTCLCVLCDSAFNQNAKLLLEMKRNRKDAKNAKVRKDDYLVLCVTSVIINNCLSSSATSKSWINNVIVYRTERKT